MSELLVNYEPLTPISFLKRNAVVYPDKTAVIYNDKRFTYKEFNRRVNRLASALKQNGIKKNDKVAFMSPNIPAMLEAHFGVPLAGGVLVSINIRLSSKEIAYIINQSETKILFVDKEFAGVIEPVLAELKNVQLIVNIEDGVGDVTLPGTEYEKFIAEGSPEEMELPIENELDNITINYTSGTTGLPKGVMYSHRNAYLNALGACVEHGLNNKSVYLWTLPMFHCNGWCFPWAVTAAAGTHVCLRKVVPEEIYRLIEKEAATMLCAAPIVLISMSNFPGAKDVNLKAPLRVVTGGAPPAPTVIRNMESIGAEVVQVYGLTEVYGPHTVCEWQEKWDGLSFDDKAKIKARQGVAYITAVHVKVVDGEMNEVPHDGQFVGEIVMRGNNVMLGYYKQPEDTAEAFRGGWFHSGDVAVVHPDSYIEIKDRSKDVIISGGENISSVEVENVLYQHPDVLEVAVIGVPDEKWGEVPKAFVVPKPGASPTAEDIINFCRQHIARFKCPKHVQFGELPKTATGKIQKYVLRNKEWAGRDKKVN